jgi:hypothetical protein
MKLRVQGKEPCLFFIEESEVRIEEKSNEPIEEDDDGFRYSAVVLK